MNINDLNVNIITSAKGGTGKTILALCLFYQYNKMCENSYVVLIDLNFHNNDLSTIFDADMTKENYFANERCEMLSNAQSKRLCFSVVRPKKWWKLLNLKQILDIINDIINKMNENIPSNYKTYFIIDTNLSPWNFDEKEDNILILNNYKKYPWINNTLFWHILSTNSIKYITRYESFFNSFGHENMQVNWVINVFDIVHNAIRENFFAFFQKIKAPSFKVFSNWHQNYSDNLAQRLKLKDCPEIPHYKVINALYSLQGELLSNTSNLTYQDILSIWKKSFVQALTHAWESYRYLPSNLLIIDFYDTTLTKYSLKLQEIYRNRRYIDQTFEKTLGRFYELFKKFMLFRQKVYNR